MNQAIVSVGSNINPSHHIKQAKNLLSTEHVLLKTSKIIRTKPIGFKDQPDFQNGAFLVNTTLALKPFQSALKKIETKLGRKKTSNRNGPRTIDLDITLWNDQIIDPDFYERDYIRQTVSELIPKKKLSSILKETPCTTPETFILILNQLKKQYPKWKAPALTLMAQTTGNPFKILISTLLSLRTRDQVTSEASKRLYQVADTPETIRKLPLKTLEKLIYPVGFYRNKAKQIKELCQTLIDTHSNKVPNTLTELLQFKGVGRKTANLVLSLGYNIPAICVDIHVHRITNRLGVVQTQTPEQTEFRLMEIIPKRHWKKINTLLVAFGQTICQPIRPKCNLCEIKNCPNRQEEAT